MSLELATLQKLLTQGGLHAALRLLNGRTPHRYTGVFRYDGEVLRNLALVEGRLRGPLPGAARPAASVA